MKKLFVTDLDGTFLTGSAQASESSVALINGFIEKGGYFTFATARTASSAAVIMKDVNVNVPCILMNGVSIYDLRERKYVKNEYFSAEQSWRTAEIFAEHHVIPFMYKIVGERLTTHYFDFNCKEMYDFFLSRGNTPDRPFYKCENLTGIADDSVVYFSVQGDHDKLEKVAKALEKEKICSHAFYRDVYNTGIWFLEVFSKNASKSKGIEFIRNYGGFDHVTCFGDNLNDLPMFGASDFRVAVSNAKDEVKEAADLIIESNNDDAVAKFIVNN